MNNKVDNFLQSNLINKDLIEINNYSDCISIRIDECMIDFFYDEIYLYYYPFKRLIIEDWNLVCINCSRIKKIIFKNIYLIENPNNSKFSLISKK